MEAVAQLRSRLEKLETYLKADPSNDSLLMDAFRTALQCSEWERAAVYLRHGQSLQTRRLQWALCEAEMWLAQNDLLQARVHLESLALMGDAPAEFRLAVAHDLGFIAFREGNFADCAAQLAPFLDADTEAAHVAPSPLTQQMWLRALHRTGELERACRWAKLTEAKGCFGPQCASIASLIALDASDIANAQRWAAMALQQLSEQDRPLEALVTQASLALAAGDAAQGEQFALAALQISPADGRAWSAQAFAQMLAGQFNPALQSFAKALATMPGHIGTWHGQGWTQIQLGDLNAALLSFETALALDRNFAESHGGLAVVLARQGNVVKAKEHIERAERLDKSNVSGRYAKSILSGEAADVQSLQRLAQRLLGDRPAPFGGSIADLLQRKSQ